MIYLNGTLQIKRIKSAARELARRPAGNQPLRHRLTSRKLVVDNYEPRTPIGGGAFSGKDPSKVDRSAAYMARRVAVDYLKKRSAREVYVYIAYAIGYDQPPRSSCSG